MNKKVYHIILICILVIFILFILHINVEKNIDNIASEISLPILMYHHFTTDISKCNDNTILVDKFQNDMETLKKAGYNTISFSELYEFVYNNKSLPKNPIIITIDDGYLSNYDYAYKILKDLDMKACIFVIGKTVGVTNMKNPHFSYSQAKEMYQSGHVDIQSHTYNLHDISIRKGILKLETESKEEYISMLRNDLMLSKNNIKQNVNNNVIVLSYPYGLYDNLSLNIIKQLGFKITVVTDEGMNIIQQNKFDCLYNLKRINVNNDLKGNELLQKIQSFNNIENVI